MREARRWVESGLINSRGAYRMSDGGYAYLKYYYLK